MLSPHTTLSRRRFIIISAAAADSCQPHTTRGPFLSVRTPRGSCGSGEVWRLAPTPCCKSIIQIALPQMG